MGGGSVFASASLDLFDSESDGIIGGDDDGMLAHTLSGWSFALHRSTRYSFQSIAGFSESGGEDDDTKAAVAGYDVDVFEGEVELTASHRVADDVEFTSSFGYLLRSDHGDDSTDDVTLLGETKSLDIANDDQQAPFIGDTLLIDLVTFDCNQPASSGVLQLSARQFLESGDISGFQAQASLQFQF